MIIRILEDGQYDVPDEHLDVLNELDDRLLAAVESTDDAAVAPALLALTDAVRRLGTPLAVDTLVSSEFVLPGAGTEAARIRALISNDGLIPG